MFSPEAFYFYMIINLYTEMKKNFFVTCRDSVRPFRM